MFRWLRKLLHMASINDPRCQPGAYIHNELRMLRVVSNDARNVVRVEDCYTGAEEDMSAWAIASTKSGWILIDRQPVPA